MTPQDTVRRLLVDASGEALCESCLAFACSVNLTDMHEVAEELLMSAAFIEATSAPAAVARSRPSLIWRNAPSAAVPSAVATMRWRSEATSSTRCASTCWPRTRTCAARRS